MAISAAPTQASAGSVPPPAAERRATGRAVLEASWDLRKHLDTFALAIAGLTIVSISAVHQYLGPLRYARPSLTLLALALGLLVLRPRRAAWRNLRTWPAQAVFALLFIATGSAFFGISFGGSARFLLDGYGRVLLVWLLMVVVVRDVKDLMVQIWGFVISVGILGVLSFTVLELETTSTGLGRLEGGATMFDANDLGMVVLLALPLALLLFLNSGRIGKLVSVAVMAVIPAVIALTGSRGAMVGLVAVGACLFFAMARVSFVKRVSVLLLLVTALGLSATDEYWAQMRTLLKPGEDYNATDNFGRVEIAKRGIRYMLSYPVFGVGIGNFPRAEGTISPIAQELQSQGEAIRWVAPHNTYVQVGAELGLIGFTLWLAILAGGSVGLWLRRRRVPRAWEKQSKERRFLRDAMLFVPISFVAFAVTTFFLSHAFTPPTYIIFSFHAALLAIVQKERRKDRLAKRDATRGAHGPSAAALPSA